jgi:chromosomal replication initiation ATPase DnaA
MVPIVALPDPEPVKVDIKPPPPVDALSEKVEAARAAIDRGRTSPSYEFVVAIACDCLGLPVDDVMSRSRIKAWAHARHRVLWLVFHITGSSLSEIGRRLGGWDHSTIINALDRVDAARAADPDTAAQLDAIKASIELQWQARKAQVMQ